MKSTLILADHEELYEISRMSRAIIVGIVLAVLALLAYRRVRPTSGRPWETMAGRFALAGIGAAAVTVGFGLIPRQTSRGYVICGPPLNLPDSIPAFATNADWADSVHCNGTMRGPMWWLLIGILASVVLFVTATLVDQRRAPVAKSPDGESVGT